MHRLFRRTAIAALIASVFASAPALYAQDRQQRESGAQQHRESSTQQQSAPDIRNWNGKLAELYRNGWSAVEMIDIPVRSANGERIGEVHDIIVDRNGHISRVIVEVGGLVELGDQHIGMPWNAVTIGEEMKWVQVPLKEVEAGTYSLFGRTPQGENVSTAPSSWRVNELIGDYASLQDVSRYGLVRDVIFNAQGEVTAVVVDRPAGLWGPYGMYAYPYVGYPGTYAYPLPYHVEAVVALQPFDYGQLGQQSRLSSAQADSLRTAADGSSSGVPNKEAFSKLDTDGDGLVGRSEAAADADAKSKFERLDQNADGKLSRQEYGAWSSVASGSSGQAATSQQSDGK